MMASFSLPSPSTFSLSNRVSSDEGCRLKTREAAVRKNQWTLHSFCSGFFVLSPWALSVSYVDESGPVWCVLSGGLLATPWPVWFEDLLVSCPRSINGAELFPGSDRGSRPSSGRITLWNFRVWRPLTWRCWLLIYSLEVLSTLITVKQNDFDTWEIFGLSSCRYPLSCWLWAALLSWKWDQHPSVTPSTAPDLCWEWWDSRSVSLLFCCGRPAGILQDCWRFCMSV